MQAFHFKTLKKAFFLTFVYDLLPCVLRLVPLIHLRRLFEVDCWNGDAVGEVRQVVTDVKFPRHEDKFPVVLLENHRRRVRYHQYPTEKRNISTDQQFQMNRYTVVPGFSVLGFSVLPGFRALNAGDGAWSVHKTLFRFKAPIILGSNYFFLHFRVFA